MRVITAVSRSSHILGSYHSLSARAWICHVIRTVIFALLSLGLGVAGLQAEPAESDNGSANHYQEGEWRYVMRPSDSIWSIASDYLNDNQTWIDLVRYNHIKDPAKIPPGMTLAIPFPWLRIQPAPAVAVSVSGEALMKDSQSSEWRSLSNRQYLHVGDTIKTLKGSVLVRFADGSVLRLENDTTLIFNRLSQFGKSGMTDTGLRLEKGRVSTKVEPLRENGSRYEISTPSAVAAVRGTEFRVEVNNSGSSLEVTDGKVSFTSSEGSVLVTEGHGAQAGLSGKLSLPISLPAQPTIKLLPSEVHQFPIQLAWNPVKDATAYQYQLFEGNPSDGKQVHQQTVFTPEVMINHLDNGIYSVTLRAVNQAGLQGVDDVQTLRVQLTAEPAALISPAHGEVIQDSQPVFRWAPKNPQHQAKLQVDTNDQFTHPLIDSPWLYNSQQNLDIILEPGHYYWRVVSQAGQENTATSEVRDFRIQSTLFSPQILSINHSGDLSKIFWKRVANALSYTVQLALDASFQSLEQELTTEDTHVSIRIDKGKRYYFRIRANGAPYYSTSFSEVTPIELAY